MSTYVACGMGLVVASVATYYQRARDRRAHESLDAIRSLEGLIAWVRTQTAHHASSDELTMRVVRTIREEGIRETTLVALSRLHTRYGRDDGHAGFVVNVVWSAVLHAVAAEGGVIIVD